MRIPLYNKGLGEQVGKTAGQLSPRAGFGAFTAVGQATAQFAQTAGDIAIKFGEAEKAAETDRIFNEEYLQFSTSADDSILNSTETDTKTFETNFNKKIITPTISAIDKYNITNKQKQIVKSKLTDLFRTKLTKGKQFTFNRGQVVRSNAANKSLDFNANKLATLNPNDPEFAKLLTDSSDIITEGQLKGLKLDYDKKKFASVVEIKTIGALTRGATTISQVDELISRVEKSNLYESEGQKETRLAKLKTKKDEIRKSNIATVVGSAIIPIIDDGDGDTSQVTEAELLVNLNKASKGDFSFNEDSKLLYDNMDNKDKLTVISNAKAAKENIRSDIKFAQQQKETKEKEDNDNLFEENLPKALKGEISIADINKLGWQGANGQKMALDLSNIVRNKTAGNYKNESDIRKFPEIQSMVFKGQIPDINTAFKLKGETKAKSVLQRVGDGINETDFFRLKTDLENKLNTSYVRNMKEFDTFISSQKETIKALKLFSDFDVNGDDRYYRFTVDMRTRFEQGLVDGKKARDMVNPRHPDFIFQDKSSFVPSKDELINNFKNKLKIEGVSKLDDAAIAPPQRQEGQTLDAYKKTDAYIRWSTSPLYNEWLKRRSSQ